MQFSRRQLLATIQESPHFVAPEVVLGTAEGTPDLTKVDVWSLGVILFAMLCGRLPFIHPQMKSLCKLIVASPYAEPDFVSDGTEAPHTDGLLTPQNALISFAACSASARKTAPQWRMSCSEFFLFFFPLPARCLIALCSLVLMSSDTRGSAELYRRLRICLP
jgi:serine/threonine protein kinase